jgi:hypothetical protein
MSLFSRLMDYGVESHFRKDPSGRLVFLPFGPRKKAYFVDTKSDEEKIRSFVRMYRSASTLISWMGQFPIYATGFIFTAYLGATPLRNRLTALVVTSSIYMLVSLALIWMLWGAYKQTVPSVTASLSEVGPDVRGQLSTISPRPRIVLVCLAAGLLLLAVALFAAVSHR